MKLIYSVKHHPYHLCLYNNSFFSSTFLFFFILSLFMVLTTWILIVLSMLFRKLFIKKSYALPDTVVCPHRVICFSPGCYSFFIIYWRSVRQNFVAVIVALRSYRRCCFTRNAGMHVSVPTEETFAVYSCSICRVTDQLLVWTSFPFFLPL